MVTSTARRIQRYLLNKGFECTSQHVCFNELPIDRILTLPSLSIKKKIEEKSVRKLKGLNPRRFYLTGSVMNLYSFVRDLLEWPFNELFLSDASLWNQYKFITFNIFSCLILINYCKILIITVISNEKTNELTM